MALFCLMKDPAGRRLLLNLDQCFCIQEDEKGAAVAISFSGNGVVTGEKFDTVQNDLLQEQALP